MTAMVETNPDYSRQMYEPQFNSQYRPPDPPVVTSGLVSESDIRHQERRERLKYELSKEYHDHMQKPSDGFYSDEAPLYNPEHDTGEFKEQRPPMYYHREPPEQGLPLGNYAQSRKALDEQRHREYNLFMHEKDEQARQRREEIMQRRSPPQQPPQSELYDHNQVAQHLREERRREYNDYLRRQEASELNPQRKPPTPLGGLPVGAYEEQRKRLQAERTREYRDSLLKQHKEQILNRAQNQVDMPVVDRRNQSPVRDSYQSPSVPPLGLNDRRPPSGRWDPESYRQHNYAPVKQGDKPTSRGRQASRGRLSSHETRVSIDQPPFLQDRPISQDRQYNPSMKPNSRGQFHPQDADFNLEPPPKENSPLRLSSPPHQANIGKDDYSEYRRKAERDKRNLDYNKFLAQKQMEDDAKKQRINEVRRQPPAPIIKGDYYDSESYDLKQQYLKEEKQREYREYQRKPVTPPIYGLPIGPQHYVKTKKLLELQRNRDYNEYLRKKKAQSAGRSSTPTNLGLPLSQNEYDTRRKHMERERNKEYNELLAKKQSDLQPRRPYNPNGPENRIGFMANLGTSLDRQREALAHQRHEEYNNFLKDSYYKDQNYALHGKPRGRPSWVDRQVLPDSWYKPSVQRNQDRSSQPKEDRPPPVDDRPASQRRSGTHQSYDDMLREKRRQEANYRRDDYQGYSHSGHQY